MDSQIFNPNPTIIATTLPTARRRAAQARLSLWLLDEGDDSSAFDSDGEPEPIDADEIFGPIFFICGLRFRIDLIKRFDTLYQRPRAPLDDAGTTGCRLCPSGHCDP